MLKRRIHPIIAAIGASLASMSLGGCAATLYDPALATRKYPEELSQSQVLQIQAVPQATTLQVINATATDFSDFDIWVNRRFVQHVNSMQAGKTIELKIEKFRDVWGQCPQPGGFWRTRAPTPLVFVQIQCKDATTLLGLVAVVPEDARY